jgi:ElaB/YqjD/DUF883 family membrane-anchored ribosome-binding protein
MIASTETMSESSRVRNVAVVNVPNGVDDDKVRSVAESALRTTKQWVQQHPTKAVAASVMLGLIVGYVVKRRM